MKPPIAVFDLDGTLVHTAPDLVTSLNFALEKNGFRSADYAELAPFAGMGGRGMLKHYCIGRDISLTEQQILPIITTFLEHYEVGLPGDSLFYEGAVELVCSLRSSGFKTAICTNKPQKLADKLIENLNATHLFDAICGADFFNFKKPDPRHLFDTIGLAGGEWQKSVMFGDSQTDFDTAKAANIPCVGVTFGYSPVPVSNFKLAKVIAHYGETDVSIIKSIIIG